MGEDIRKEAERIAKKLTQDSKIGEATTVTVITDSADGDSFITSPVFVSTQHVMLDIVLGGGIPSSRIVELFSSNEGAGKSTLSAHMIAETQRRGGLAVLIDSEHGSVSARLKQLGVDLNALVYVDPESIEDALTIIEESIKDVENAGVADRTFIVWDSLAATPTRSQMQGEFGDPIHIGEVARIMSHNLKRVGRVLASSKASLVIVNQGREKIGTMYGAKTTTGGGKGLKFHSATRIKMDQVSKIKSPDGSIVGVVSEIQAVKNRLAEPFAKTKLNILFKYGIDVVDGLVAALLHTGIFKKSGAWLSMEGEDKKFRVKDISKVLASADVDAIVDKLLAAGAEEDFLRYIITKLVHGDVEES